MGLFSFLKRDNENIDRDDVEKNDVEKDDVESDGGDDIPIAAVTFFVNDKEEILIDCSWDEEKSGALHMGDVIYKLSTGKLATPILTFIQEKCAKNNVEDQYMLLLGEITRQYFSESGMVGETVDPPKDINKPVVSPTEVMNESFRKPLDL